MSLTAVTVLKSGGVYSPVWVERLNSQIRAHVIGVDRIVCLTDMPVTGCDTAPLHEGWPGWFSKLAIFRPDQFTGTCVYFDLDTLIVDDVDLTHPIVESSALMMLNDLYRPEKPASGMMIWQAELCAGIYASFAKNPVCKPGFHNGDGTIIGKFPHRRIQPVFPGMVGSWKADKLQDGPKGFRVICYHGTPKQSDLPADSWARKVWESDPVKEA